MNVSIVTTPGLSGDVYSTEFVFSKVAPSYFTDFTWDLGDGNRAYNVASVSHTYDYPGIYTITLSAWSELGVTATATTYVTVDYVYRDRIEFTQIPNLNGLPGLASNRPFVISLTSSKIDQQLKVVLQPLNTNSIPYSEVPTKWNFLVPRWRFLDATTKTVLQENAIEIVTQPIYKDSKVVAVSGQASFYYIDDLSTGIDPNTTCPLVILATLSTLHFTYPPESLIYPYYSYSNNETVKTGATWRIEDIVPTNLHVTENFLNNIYEVKWTNAPIPVLITCNYDPGLLPNYTPLTGIGVSSTKVLSYPRTNEFGRVSPVKLSLSGLANTDYTVEGEPLYFRATDENGNVDSGYIFTTITSLSPISSTVVMASTIATNHSSAGSAVFSFPYGYPISSQAYISHSAENIINKISLFTPRPISTCVESSKYIKSEAVAIGTTDSFAVPVLGSYSTANYNLSGSGIYAIAVDPTTNKIFAGDADQEWLYCYDSSGIITHSVELSTITNDPYNTPSCISIDGNHHVWVSLLNSQMVLKFDSSLNLLASASPADATPIALVQSGSSLTAPPTVETDSENNVWVSYSHPLSSRIFKFDQFGTQLIQASPLPVSSVPVGLAIDANDDLWVACRESNEIRCYNKNDGTLRIAYNGILKPSYICVDRESYIWFTHGHNFCSKLNPITSFIETWRYDNISEQLVLAMGGYTANDILLANTDNEIWSGLSVDVYNRVWLVDYTKNKTVVFYTGDTANIQILPILPNATTNYIIHPVTGNISPVIVPIVYSAQAVGDWTGNKWYQKYAGKLNSVAISGVSTEFKILDINTPLFLSKNNEEFDFAAHLKSLALPEILQQNTVLFDKFFPGVVGDGDPTIENLGRVVYEKVANFTDSHGDYQTSNVKQLISYAEQLSVPIKDFGVDYPASIQRLVDLFSIPKHLLRGLPNIENDISVNLGIRLDFTQTISAGEYIFSKDKTTSLYQLIYVTALSSGNTSFPLSAIELEGFKLPITNYYDFFSYIPSESDGYISNIVNWDSPYTTVSYNVSSNNEWYGKDGIAELMFNQLLTKALVT